MVLLVLELAMVMSLAKTALQLGNDASSRNKDKLVITFT